MIISTYICMQIMLVYIRYANVFTFIILNGLLHFLQRCVVDVSKSTGILLHIRHLYLICLNVALYFWFISNLLELKSYFFLIFKFKLVYHFEIVIHWQLSAIQSGSMLSRWYVISLTKFMYNKNKIIFILFT